MSTQICLSRENPLTSFRTYGAKILHAKNTPFWTQREIFTRWIKRRISNFCLEKSHKWFNSRKSLMSRSHCPQEDLYRLSFSPVSQHC